MKYTVTIGGQDLEVEVDGTTVRVDGKELEAHLSPVPGVPLRHLMLGDQSHTIGMQQVEPGTWRLLVDGVSLDAAVVDERTRHIRSLTGGGAARSGPTTLKAPMPGLVLRVLVAPGQAVTPGEGLAVLEAMKMENELRATSAATVREVRVTAGQTVDKGQVLIEFET